MNTMNTQFAIYCDFDGTITTRDTVDFLLEGLADPKWQDIEKLWEQGKIGSRECMAQQIPLIRGGWPAIEQLLSEVVIDPTFSLFSQWCAQQGIPLVIVSEGLDRVIHFLLEREGLSVPGVWANTLCEDAQGNLSLRFPNAPTDLNCQAGLCKCSIINKPYLHKEPGVHRIVIGDGLSDRCWAEEADTLFAKSKLITHCQNNQITFIPFDNFDAIRNVLEKQLRLFPKQQKDCTLISDKKSVSSC
jgi:2-hydroxy-3-keto-5-methylthiopentenyl-1-phosphate phosphatase